MFLLEYINKFYEINQNIIPGPYDMLIFKKNEFKKLLALNVYVRIIGDSVFISDKGFNRYCFHLSGELETICGISPFYFQNKMYYKTEDVDLNLYLIDENFNYISLYKEELYFTKTSMVTLNIGRKSIVMNQEENTIVKVNSSVSYPYWNPKFFFDRISINLVKIYKEEFLYLYFLMKNILGNKLNNKDLRQYIFRFLFDLN
jgi:hypothetical protein